MEKHIQVVEWLGDANEPRLILICHNDLHLRINKTNLMKQDRQVDAILSNRYALPNSTLKPPNINWQVSEPRNNVFENSIKKTSGKVLVH